MGAPIVPDPTQPSENPLGIVMEQVEDVHVLRFHNAKILNERSVNEMGNRLLDCVSSSEGPPKIVVRFDSVSFLSSMAVGKLVMVQRKVKERGGELKLCDLKPSTLDIFRASRLIDYFEIYPDSETAMGDFS